MRMKKDGMIEGRYSRRKMDRERERETRVFQRFPERRGSERVEAGWG